jgi:DNA-binding NarL/FixJ family response regulator
MFAALIVDDQPAMRSALRDFIQATYPQAALMEASNGADAMRMCISHDPRLVLMDISLPDSTGIALTARIKTLLPNTRVIIVSQHADSTYVRRAMEAGADGYVVKDNVSSELLPKIAAALRDKVRKLS